MRSIRLRSLKRWKSQAIASRRSPSHAVRRGSRWQGAQAPLRAQCAREDRSPTYTPPSCVVRQRLLKLCIRFLVDTTDARDDHGRPPKLIASDVQDQADKFEPGMAAAPTAVRFLHP